MKTKKLHHIKSSGFNIPDGYLESVDESVLNKLKNNGALENRQNSGFKVPDQYFEILDDKLIEAVSTKQEVKVISLITWKKALYVSGIAASIVLMISLFNNFEAQPTFDNLEMAFIEDYISEEDFTNEDMATLLNDDLSINHFMDSHLIDSNLEDYILNNSSVEDFLNE